MSHLAVFAFRRLDASDFPDWIAGLDSIVQGSSYGRRGEHWQLQSVANVPAAYEYVYTMYVDTSAEVDAVEMELLYQTPAWGRHWLMCPAEVVSQTVVTDHPTNPLPPEIANAHSLLVLDFTLLQGDRSGFLQWVAMFEFLLAQGPASGVLWAAEMHLSNSPLSVKWDYAYTIPFRTPTEQFAFLRWLDTSAGWSSRQHAAQIGSFGARLNANWIIDRV